MAEEEQEPIVMDGYIEIWAHDPYADAAIHNRFSFNDIGMINVELWGIRINLTETSDTGQETIFMWPWPQILKVKHVTNSTEVAEKLQARDVGEYAQSSIDLIEQLANGAEIQEAGHIHQNEGDNLKVAHGYETPCGHGAAVQSEDNPVWTCLTCASQWKDDQWHVT